MNMKAPRNTTRREGGMEIGGTEILLSALAGQPPSAAIDAQEARGQKSLVESDTLPTDGLEGLVRMGIEIVGAVPDDPMFSYVKLPAGWTKKRTDHSMHSDLVDDKGRVRAGMFYKAAFYDRSAHIHATQRFSVTMDYDRKDKTGEVTAVVKDGETEIFRTAPIDKADLKEWEVADRARNGARAWLGERYPDWQDPHAYWE